MFNFDKIMKVCSVFITLTLLFLELFYSNSAYAQKRADVIYMLDGSVINAVVLDEGPSSMQVMLMTKDTIELSYDNIDHIRYGNRSIKDIDEIIKNNRPVQTSRFLNKSGFLVDFNTGYLVGTTPSNRSPFRSFSVGAELGFGTWFAHRYYLGAGANAETFVRGSGNAGIFGESRIHFSKGINSPFIKLRGGYLIDLASRGRNYGSGVSNYNYSGFRGPIGELGIGYRVELSNFLLMRFTAGYQYMDLTATETWEAFQSEINSQVHRARIGIGLSF